MRSLVWVTGALAAIALSACGSGCVSTQTARTAMEALSRRNDARLTEALERAVAERGAVLLEGELVSLPPPCMGHEQASAYRRLDCVRAEALGEGVWRLWTSQGEAKLALVLNRIHLDRGERLARNETNLFVLTPIPARRKVDEGVRCECDGMPNVYPDETLAIVVDDAPIRSVARVAVSYTHDFIDWECKVYLL